MSLLISSDLHLGHRNICKYRTNFSSPEEHHNIIFDNLASNVNKRDSLILLGDIAFSKEWLQKIKSIRCTKKLLICGNHDLEHGIKMRDLVDVYDDVKALYSLKGVWLSHCPIHEQELRGRSHNIHGHLHDKLVMLRGFDLIHYYDKRYINVCVEHTDYKPVDFHKLLKERRCYDIT